MWHEQKKVETRTKQMKAPIGTLIAYRQLLDVAAVQDRIASVAAWRTGEPTYG